MPRAVKISFVPGNNSHIRCFSPKKVLFLLLNNPKTGGNQQVSKRQSKGKQQTSNKLETKN